MKRMAVLGRLFGEKPPFFCFGDMLPHLREASVLIVYEVIRKLATLLMKMLLVTMMALITVITLMIPHRDVLSWR